MGRVPHPELPDTNTIGKDREKTGNRVNRLGKNQKKAGKNREKRGKLGKEEIRESENNEKKWDQMAKTGRLFHFAPLTDGAGYEAGPAPLHRQQTSDGGNARWMSMGPGTIWGGGERQRGKKKSKKTKTNKKEKT